MQRIAIILSIVVLSACATERQERATATGAAVGATAGAAIGSQNNQVVEGALIGGMIGAAAGAAIGAPDPQPAYRTHAHRPHHRVVREAEQERRYRHHRRED
ncbi:MAG TPA: YMGG-like glycine zipper-containing protein [Mariprofundaceae bacterium]|nr:YMGG-like glycine zipper-containing protein [Mariprofundaceae bacterium]